MKTKLSRKKHSASFKAKVAMEAMMGIKTVVQIAKEYGVHPVQVSQWKCCGLNYDRRKGRSGTVGISAMFPG